MGLLTEEDPDQKLNTFWREVVLPDEATTQRSTPEALTQRVNEAIALLAGESEDVCLRM